MVCRLAALLLFLIAILGTASATEPLPKPAWQWPAEERGLADRFTGRTHPELFLPYEVFESW